MKDKLVILPKLELWIGKSKSKDEREAVVMKAVSIATQIKRRGQN